MTQIGNVPYTDVFGDGTIVLAETLKDCGSCVVQFCRFVATHIDAIDKQLAGVEVYYARKDLSQR